jgi:hypothetical protein
MENSVEIRMDAKGVNALLDYLKANWEIKTDAELAGWLECTRPQISRVRGGYVPFGDIFILSVHEVFEIPIKEIKERLRG